MPRVVRIVANGTAGSMRAESDRALLEQQLATALPGAVILWSDEDHSIDELITLAMLDSPTLLVAAGGDGTINAVASAIVDTDIVLGVLPAGTLNHFAKDLGIPTGLADAVSVLRDGTARRVDVGSVNDRIFLNNAGLGLYPEIVRRREAKQRQGLSKWPAAIVAALRALARYRELGIRLRTDTTTLLRRTPAVFVGNNEYINHDTLKPHRDSLTGGTLSVFIPRARSRWQLLWFTIRAMIGNVQSDRGFEMLTLERMTVEAKHRLAHVSIDGEVVKLETPLAFESRPGALLVMAPAIAQPSDGDGAASSQTPD